MLRRAAWPEDGIPYPGGVAGASLHAMSSNVPTRLTMGCSMRDSMAPMSTKSSTATLRA